MLPSAGVALAGEGGPVAVGPMLAQFSESTTGQSNGPWWGQA